MKYRFSATRKASFIVVFGYEILIEYRVRLKTFDLVFYPNKGRMYGQSQFYDKFVCRHNDFTALMACIIKASEDFAETNSGQLFYNLKIRCSELIANEAMANAECPAQGSSTID